MILEYNYDKGNIVLEHFRKAELATLDIRKALDADESVKFVMEYTFVKDYPEPKQNLIREVLSNSLSERLQLVNILNQFIENQILDNVQDFSLRFNVVNVRKCEITYSSSYKQTTKKTVNLIDEFVKCLEQYDHIVTEMGVANQVAANIFRKEGSGRNKKYVPLTIKDIGNTLRKSLMEE